MGLWSVQNQLVGVNLPPYNDEAAKSLSHNRRHKLIVKVPLPLGKGKNSSSPSSKALKFHGQLGDGNCVLYPMIQLHNCTNLQFHRLKMCQSKKEHTKGHLLCIGRLKDSESRAKEPWLKGDWGMKGIPFLRNTPYPTPLGKLPVNSRINPLWMKYHEPGSEILYLTKSLLL